MGRARRQILSAAADLVAAGGLRAVTMASVARRSAVAKATVYNHFRDRDDLLRALMQTKGEELVVHCSGVPEGDRLTAAAGWLSRSALIGGLRRYDPATILSLATEAAVDPGVREVVARWSAVDAGIETGTDTDTDTDRALRWLVSFLVVPD